MTGSRRALLIATDKYADPTFRQLRSPAADVRELAAVLGDPSIGDYQVDVRHNRAEPEVSRAIEDFFADAGLDDLILLYLSGHGVKDDAGKLHLATADSRHGRLGSTAVSAHFVRDQMRRSRSRRIVVLLDCCYAGAFPVGMRDRAGARIDVLEQLSDGEPRGRGSVVVTSSSALEYAYEPDGKAIAVNKNAGPSVFTQALVDGMRTGEADRNGDGVIDTDELYDYVFERVRDVTPHQNPQRMADLRGKLDVAKSPRGPQPDVILPSAVVDAVRSPLEAVRIAILHELARLANSTDEVIAVAARTTLRELTTDRVGRVAIAARAALDALDQSIPPRRPPLPRPSLSPDPPSFPGAPSLAWTRGPLSRVRRLLAVSVALPAVIALMTTAASGSPNIDEKVNDISGQPIILTGDSGPIDSLAFSPNGTVLASGNHDGTMTLWDTTNPAHASVLHNVGYGNNNGDPVNALAISPDGNIVAAAGADGIELWRITGSDGPVVLSNDIAGNSTGSFSSVAFSPDGHLLVAGGYDGSISRWDMTDPTHPTPGDLIGSSNGIVDSLGFSAQGNTLGGYTVAGIDSYGAGDLLVSIPNEPHNTKWAKYSYSTDGPPNGEDTVVAFDSGGDTLATGDDQGISLVDVTEPENPSKAGEPLAASGGYSSAVTFSPNGHSLAGVGARGVSLWDVNSANHSGVPTRQIPGSFGSAAFNPSGNILATGDRNDDDILLWNVS
ncbi:MAG TPA: caspase family protein [Pseudonocardiaceae bacterium]|jgi:WD40 repeat protein|nr:caspase family protein [Pseudonocardiaceae bacterium]